MVYLSVEEKRTTAKTNELSGIFRVLVVGRVFCWFLHQENQQFSIKIDSITGSAPIKSILISNCKKSIKILNKKIKQNNRNKLKIFFGNLFLKFMFNVIGIMENATNTINNLALKNPIPAPCETLKRLVQ